MYRTSDNQDPNGNQIPPWKEVQVSGVFSSKQPPVIGKKVTVVPINANAPILDLTILETKASPGCGDTGSGWWEVKLEPVKQKEYFEITKPGRREESPFGVVVIYPAVKFARQIGRNELRKTMLPPGTVLEIVMAAIDLTNDGIPDVLMTDYCCSQPAKAPNDNCDYTCGKTFLKIGNGWKLVDTSAPC